MRFLFTVCCLLFSLRALAEITVPIEKQDWKITMNTPPLAKKVAREVGANFVFQANSGKFNANYYFAFAGKWLDVHISIIERQKGDEEILAAFEKGLKYGK